MAVLEFVGNFNYETRQLNEKSSAIDASIKSINTTLQNLSSYWQDDTSASHLAEWQESLNEISRLASECFTEAQTNLDNCANYLLK